MRCGQSSGKKRFNLFTDGFYCSTKKMVQDSLEKEILDLIIEVCNVEEFPEGGIGSDAPLTGPDSPLHLDSLDSVEIVVAVQAQYNVRIDNQRLARRVLKTLKSLADFIRSETQDQLPAHENSSC